MADELIPVADALARIRAAFADDPGLTAVFGSYDDAPPGGTVAAFRNLLHHHVHHRGAGPASTFWSGLGAIRRDAFLAVGGFDGERFPHPSVEDVDLAEGIMTLQTQEVAYKATLGALSRAIQPSLVDFL